MKLAEALSIRKELQTRIDQLKVRINNNVRVQEGEEPAEEPQELLKLFYPSAASKTNALDGTKIIVSFLEIKLDIFKLTS